MRHSVLMLAPWLVLGADALAGNYTAYKGLNCFAKHGGANIDSGKNATVKPVGDCLAYCDATPGCVCVVHSAAAGKCWRRSGCWPAQCSAATPSAYVTYIKPGSPPAPPSPPPAPAPVPVPPAPSPGPACADCPNILLMFTDDQDQIIGGWGSDRSASGGRVAVPTMTRTDARVGARGATATQWRIHTPICAPSRSQLQSGRYYHNIANNATGPAGAKWVTPSGKVTSGAVGMLDLGNKVWPHHFARTLREQRGYATALFGKCMNGNCGPNAQAAIGGRQQNLHRMGAFDRWFEGTGYQNGAFYDNAKAGCAWPWPETGASCTTKTSSATAGAGYLTSELGNRTVAWLRSVNGGVRNTRGVGGAASGGGARRPWFVYFATHAPHGPFTPAAWYKDACEGVRSPRLPNFNYSGRQPGGGAATACTLRPPGESDWALDGPRRWWNGTEFQELVSCQPPFSEAEVAAIDANARKRCQCLLSVDDTYAEIVDAVEELGELNRTYVIVTSDHGFNLGHHRIPTAKMTMYEHSLRIPQLFMGPGIRRNSTFDFLGTQVDLAPTILGMAGIDTPPYMDGRSVLPLLASARAAEEQGERLPGSVARHLRQQHAPRATAAAAADAGGGAGQQQQQQLSEAQRTASRVATFHEFYNEGPFGNEMGQGSGRRPYDDWSNTWLGLYYAGGGRRLKYAEFDPYGKQTGFAKPYMYQLHDLEADPYELRNIYNDTKATPDGAALLGTLHALLRKYYECKGQTCP